eukprot:scaffold2817_cov130-Cylindrotheca_fusiformis.AAC.16
MPRNDTYDDMLGSQHGPPSAEPTTSTPNNQTGIVQVLETEVWDETNQAWKASGERWTTTKGNPSASPSEMKPPEGFEFEGDWKIVVSSGDAMGWEYQYQYLRPPKRKRTWLRSTKQSRHQAGKAAPSAVSFRPKGPVARSLSMIHDDFNFKGYGVALFKSLIFPKSMGISLRLPLTTNFGTWDRHPEFPNFSSSVSFMFPWTIGAFLSGSVHLEWVKWAVKCVLQFIPRLVIYCIYEIFLPFLWMFGAALVSPTGYRLPQLPIAPKISIPRPKYDPDISERVGCSVSYRWSQQRGVEWRISYFHSYLPTLTAYRKLLRMNSPLGWWQKHFASIGLSTSYPIPSPPNFSCSAQLSLSGFNFQKPREAPPAEVSSILENEIQVNETDTDAASIASIPQTDKVPAPRLVSTTKAGSLT